MGLWGPSDESVYALANAVNTNTFELRLLRDEIRKLTQSLKRPRRPGVLMLQMTGEKVRVGMADKLTFNVVVPAEPVPTDVVRREAELSLPDGTTQTATLEGAGESRLGPFEGDEGASVGVSVVNVDNAGNSGPPRQASFTLVDTIPPVAPGEIGLEIVSETPGA